MTVLRSGSASDVGRVRSVNEDRLLESGSLFAVADGMGGHAGGEVAAGIAVEVLARAFGTDPSATGLVDAVRRANVAVWERSHRDADVRGMGTTLIAAALVPTGQGDRLVVANVGDSRAYRFADGHLEQMTTDHSVAEELVARGELSEAEAAVHPHRHILTRALGVAPDVDVDTWEVVPAEGERYLLCSDGLTNEVSEERIGGVLAEVRDPRQAARRLVAMANEHGGNDNITVVVLDVVVADSDATASRTGGAGRAGTPAGTPGAIAATTALAVGAGVDAERTGGHGRPAGRGTGRRSGPVPDAPAPSADGGADELPTVTVSSRPTGRMSRPTGGVSPGSSTAGLLQADASSEGSEDPPEMLARHVTAALSEVMGRRRAHSRGGGLVERRRARRLTARVALFVVLVLAVLAGAVAVVRYYAEDTWYVRLDGSHVAVYQGRPGGFLGFEPHVVEVTGLTEQDVLAYRVAELRSGVQESSRQAADQFVANLRTEFCSAQPQAAACARSAASSAAAP